MRFDFYSSLLRRAAARLAIGSAAIAAAVAIPGSAEAFSTRVHIMLANRVHDAVVAGEGSIELWQGGRAVRLDEDDARAIIEAPEAFRAGAIGPDNMIMPGLTDPSHAIRQRPYEQCQRLYEAAVVDKERAYALGCFLHGSTDAIAHQYVNYMSGETFTMTPISHGRAEDLSNVIRHMVAEEMIQDAAFAADPDAFSSAALEHEIPKGFVLRSYFDLESPVHELMAAEVHEKWNAVLDENPDASLLDVITALPVAPADQFVLLPLYVQNLHVIREWLGDAAVANLEEMQDWNSEIGSELGVMEGEDGVLGTYDDETACAATCPASFGWYFLHVGLLTPRFDAGGNPLPPAWDKVSDKLAADIDDLSPSLVDVIQNVSTALNTGLDAEGTGIGDLDAAAVQALFAPITTWADRTTTIDTQAIAVAVSPQWLLDMDAFFQSFGVTVDIPNLISIFLEPFVQPIRDGIRVYAIDRAKAFVNDLTSGYAAQKDATLAEYVARLEDAMPAGVSGDTFLDHFYDSGLYGHAFNITAAAFGNHAAVLPVGDDEVGLGPASFDCSHTARWMQASLCDYLRPHVFPLGEDAAGAVSILQGGQVFLSSLPGDSPIECHDGSLFAFTDDPGPSSCELTTLDALLEDRNGSVSRAYPPSASGDDLGCEDIVIPGLPEPPSGPSGSGGGGQGGDGDGDGDGYGDGDGDGDTSAVGNGATASAATGSAPGDGDGDGQPASGPSGSGAGDAGGDAAEDAGSGCACRAASTSSNGAAYALFALGAAVAIARRRARLGAVAGALLGIATSGCGDDTSDPVGAGGADASSASDASGTNSGPSGPGSGQGGASGSASSGHGGANSSSPSSSTGSLSSGEGGDGSGGAPGVGGDDASGGGDGDGDGDGGRGGDGDGDGDGGAGGGGESGAELLAAIAGTTWSGLAEQDGRERAFELTFDEDQRWALIRNPFGPARAHARGDFVVQDGETIQAVDDESGDVHVWHVTIVEDLVRELRIESEDQDLSLVEAPWSAPQDGLTAEVRVFASSGDVADAYCKSAACGIDYDLLFSFARGEDVEADLGRDVVAGSHLGSWFNVQNFAVSDVDGFDFQHLGGTELSDQYNFVVRYTGWVDHPGGLLGMREQDDDVGQGNPTDYGGVWAFLGGDVGSGSYDELFLGVNAFALCSDGSYDEPFVEGDAGYVPIEIIMIRCNTDGPSVDVEMTLADEDDWQYVGDQPTVPDVGYELFPAPLDP